MKKIEKNDGFFASSPSDACGNRGISDGLLVCTVLMDERGGRGRRVQGKLWAASLLRHLWGGGIVVRRGFPEPLFAVERAGLREEELAGAAAFAPGAGAEERLGRERERNLAEAAELPEASAARWVLLADADCLALRNPDHLFPAESGADLLVSRREGDGLPDPGFVAVRGRRLGELRRLLREAGGFAAEGLGALAGSDGWRAADFERGEVARPAEAGTGIGEILGACVLRFSGMAPEDARRLAFGLHLAAVYGDPDGIFLDLLEG